MKMKKIHRVISFTQSKWFKAYIDFNKEQRQKVTSDIERLFQIDEQCCIW